MGVRSGTSHLALSVRRAEKNIKAELHVLRVYNTLLINAQLHQQTNKGYSEEKPDSSVLHYVNLDIFKVTGEEGFKVSS